MTEWQKHRRRRANTYVAGIGIWSFVVEREYERVFGDPDLAFAQGIDNFRDGFINYDEHKKINSFETRRYLTRGDSRWTKK